MQWNRVFWIISAITVSCVGPALAAGPQLIGERPADKRRPCYIQLHDHSLDWRGLTLAFGAHRLAAVDLGEDALAQAE
jgi:hypothetical protein